MPKSSRALDSMPPVILSQLKQLGENLTIARKRRKEPRTVWAERIGVTEPTLMRMEKGDPSVSFGTYATALWLIGRVQAISELAAPELDRGALEQDVRAAALRSVRRPRAIDKALRASLPKKALGGQP